MKNKELIQRVLSNIYSGVHDDENRITSRHIYSIAKGFRDRILSLQMNKKQEVAAHNYQILPCVELMEIPIELCPCVPPSGCTILRSKHEIPETIDSLYGNGIVQVMTLSRKKITPIKSESLTYVSDNKYTSKSLKYFLEGKYLYIVSSVVIKMVTVQGLFSDVIGAGVFPNACDTCKDCNSDCQDFLELDFPIDADLEAPLLEMVKAEILSSTRKTEQDGEQNQRQSDT